MGSLKIGPESAGALPGPACYGLGGERPTVTDANLVLGYLNPQALAGGTVSINKKLSEQAINKYIAEPMKLDLMETAYGIYTVANASMMRAVRAVTTYREGIQEISFCLHFAEPVVCTLLTSQKR